MLCWKRIYLLSELKSKNLNWSVMNPDGTLQQNGWSKIKERKKKQVINSYCVNYYKMFNDLVSLLALIFCAVFAGTISTWSANMFVRAQWPQPTTLLFMTSRNSNQTTCKGMQLFFHALKAADCNAIPVKPEIKWTLVFSFGRLAYKLTHLYYNWPGTVRVPAPCQVC